MYVFLNGRPIITCDSFTMLRKMIQFVHAVNDSDSI